MIDVNGFETSYLYRIADLREFQFAGGLVSERYHRWAVLNGLDVHERVARAGGSRFLGCRMRVYLHSVRAIESLGDRWARNRVAEIGLIESISSARD
jgi:hypothetical protein